MIRSIHLWHPASLIIIAFLISSCTPAVARTVKPAVSPTISAPQTFVARALTQISATQTAQPTPVIEGYNPLTGLPVQDPALLQIPVALVSISHFPVNARPQAGMSFAPYVFEIYITEGATRFLTAFYGEFPAPEVPIVGNCEVRREPFTQTGLILGNRVWLDLNGDSIQEAWERGVGGVCVNLYDANGTLLQQTTTDSNGYYGFNVEPGKYIVEFAKPPELEFAQKAAGEGALDSDVDQATGRTDTVDVTTSLLDLDAGLIPLSMPPPTSELAPAKVGPVRSGRLVYRHIAAFFPDSCLIYAFASPEVLQYLPKCAFVEHDIQGGGYMLDISDMIRDTKDNKKSDQVVDYTSNIYSAEPPEGGVGASRLHVYTAWLNQSAWVYDPLYQAWWRYVDDADLGTPGIVHPEVDRLTGRQLHFENVIVLFAKHDVISPTNLEIHLEQDWLGDALLFRDGKMYKIRWSTVATDAEIQSGRRKPIQFLNLDDKTPFPLKPGHTWISIVTPETTVTEQSAGQWLLQFVQPAGAK
ncbi:MAG TPA: SdrD B-like domain-containing protein [Anaerolineales bacterium]|nr:SdrD B-like domain-containing protein [Anaerolineales bacterium]